MKIFTSSAPRPTWPAVTAIAIAAGILGVLIFAIFAMPTPTLAH